MTIFYRHLFILSIKEELRYYILLQASSISSLVRTPFEFKDEIDSRLSLQYNILNSFYKLVNRKRLPIKISPSYFYIFITGVTCKCCYSSSYLSCFLWSKYTFTAMFIIMYIFDTFIPNIYIITVIIPSIHKARHILLFVSFGYTFF